MIKEEAIKELKYVIDYCEKFKKEYYTDEIYTTNIKIPFKAIETVLNLINKQDKIIDLMTEYLANEYIYETICKYIECKTDTEEISCTDCIKQYFEEKVEESN